LVSLFNNSVDSNYLDVFIELIDTTGKLELLLGVCSKPVSLDVNMVV